MKRLVASLLLVALLVPAAARAQSGGGGPIPMQHSAALEGSHVFAGTKMASISVFWSTIAARYLQIYDETTITGGSLTNMVYCQILVGSGTAAGNQVVNFPYPILNSTGVSVVISTNASGCAGATTDGANDYIAAQVF